LPVVLGNNMTPESIVDLFRQALHLILLMLAVLILPGLFTGLLVSLFQAATQINEQSLSFVPKLLVTFGVVMLSGPWLLHHVINFTQNLMNNLPYYIG